MAFITYQKFSQSNEKLTSLVTIYQVGIYNQYNNALDKSKQLSGAIIMERNNQYQVIAGVSKSKDASKKIETLLNNQNVDYYKKEQLVTSELISVIDDYELMITKTNKEDTLNLLNQKLLKTLQERMN